MSTHTQYLWQRCAVVLLALAATGVSAQAMNKCTAANGKVTYQDDACVGTKAEKAEIPHYKPPPPPGTVVTPVPPVVSPVAPPNQPKTKAQALPEGATVHTGPRGGRYIVLPSGKKRYLPKEP